MSVTARVCQLLHSLSVNAQICQLLHESVSYCTVCQLLHESVSYCTVCQLLHSLSVTARVCQLLHSLSVTAQFVSCCTFCSLVGCLTSQQHASGSQGRICTDNFTCCHTKIKVADQTFYPTQSQYTDTGPTSPSTDPITPGAGRVATGVPIFKSLDPRKIPAQTGFETRILSLEADALTTRPKRRSGQLQQLTYREMTLLYQAPGRVATGVPVFKSLV